jgi:phosphoribosylglycinamide formyltransferase-1
MPKFMPTVKNKVTATIDPKIYAGRDEYEASIQAMLEIHRIDLVCLAGYMRILGPLFVNRWRGRMINIHPSLLPAYRGLHTHERALADGVAEHGCTVHFVEPELDAGPIIAQARVPVAQGDDAESLAARVLAEEHRIYPQALAEVAARIALEGNKYAGRAHSPLAGEGVGEADG